MELEPLFTGTKWSIIKAISNKPKSPIELSFLLKTSVANVSQQLRLLEFSGLVIKKRLSAREKGKPRVVYSLSDNYSFLISFANGFSNKRLLKTTAHHQNILRIWFIDDVELHYYLEKLYWQIEPKLKHLQCIAVSITNNTIEVLFVPIQKDVRIRTDSAITSPEGKTFSIKQRVLSVDQLRSLYQDNFHIIYDPDNMLKKTGNAENETN